MAARSNSRDRIATAERIVAETFGERARLTSSGRRWEVVYLLGSGQSPVEAALEAETMTGCGTMQDLAQMHELRGENNIAEPAAWQMPSLKPRNVRKR